MMNIVLEKLTCEKHAAKFYACEKQKELLVPMTTLFLEWNEDFDVCGNGHLPHVLMGYILSAAANTFLNTFANEKTTSCLKPKQLNGN